MIKAIIIEDELHNRNNIMQLVKQYCPNVEIAAMAENADEGIRMIHLHKPQLVFLDIQMPGKNAFEMLVELNRYNFEIIFITAYGEYSLKAIRFSAIDYLLKPLNIEELKSAVDKASERLRLKQENENLRNLVHYLSTDIKNEHKIAINSIHETRLVAVDEIIRCESDNTYTFFYLMNNEKLLSTAPISYYEELLSAYGLLRCHQSHLVNKKHIKSILKKDGLSLLMVDASCVPLSKQKKELVRKELFIK